MGLDIACDIKCSFHQIIKLQLKHKPRMSKHAIMKARSQHEKLEEGDDPALSQPPMQSHPFLQSLSTQTDPELESPMSMWDTFDDLTDTQPSLTVAADIFMLSISKHAPGLAPAVRALLDSLLIFLSNLPSSLLCDENADDELEFCDSIEPMYVPHDLLALLRVFFVIDDVLTSRQLAVSTDLPLEVSEACEISSDSSSAKSTISPVFNLNKASIEPHALPMKNVNVKDKCIAGVDGNDENISASTYPLQSVEMCQLNSSSQIDISSRRVERICRINSSSQTDDSTFIIMELCKLNSSTQTENLNTPVVEICKLNCATQTDISATFVGKISLNEIISPHQLLDSMTDASTQWETGTILLSEFCETLESSNCSNTSDRISQNCGFGNDKRICVVAPLLDSTHHIGVSPEYNMTEIGTQTDSFSNIVVQDAQIVPCKSPDSVEMEQKITFLLNSLNVIAESLGHENLSESQSLEANSLLSQMESSIPNLELLFSSFVSAGNSMTDSMNTADISASATHFVLGHNETDIENNFTTQDAEFWGPPAIFHINVDEENPPDEVASPPLSMDNTPLPLQGTDQTTKTSNGLHAESTQPLPTQQHSGQSLTDVWALSQCQTNLSLPIYSLASWWRMQQSLGWAFPPGLLFSCSSPMAALLTPLGNQSPIH